MITEEVFPYKMWGDVMRELSKDKNYYRRYYASVERGRQKDQIEERKRELEKQKEKEMEENNAAAEGV